MAQGAEKRLGLGYVLEAGPAELADGLVISGRRGEKKEEIVEAPRSIL